MKAIESHYFNFQRQIQSSEWIHIFQGFTYLKTLLLSNPNIYCNPSTLLESSAHSSHSFIYWCEWHWKSMKRHIIFSVSWGKQKVFFFSFITINLYLEHGHLMWLFKQSSFSKLNLQKRSLCPQRNQLTHLLQYGCLSGFRTGYNLILLFY